MWVTGWVEGEKRVEMSCWTLWVGGRVGGWDVPKGALVAVAVANGIGHPVGEEGGEESVYLHVEFDGAVVGGWMGGWVG